MRYTKFRFLVSLITYLGLISTQGCGAGDSKSVAGDTEPVADGGQQGLEARRVQLPGRAVSWALHRTQGPAGPRSIRRPRHVRYQQVSTVSHRQPLTW